MDGDLAQMTRAVDNDFLQEAAAVAVEQEHLPVPELSPVYVYKPPPPPKPLLPDNRPLARTAAQPERLAAMRAAPLPLVEAAQPLLHALAHLPQSLEAEHLTEFRQVLEIQIADFQSVCGEAGIRHDYTTIASYALCTALDEAAVKSPWGSGSDREVGAWSGHPLAARFHGDTAGGLKVFKMLGVLCARIPEEPGMLGCLELMRRLLDAGFHGMYASSDVGLRTLEDIRHRLDDIIQAARDQAEAQTSTAYRFEAQPNADSCRLGWSDHLLNLVEDKCRNTLENAGVAFELIGAIVIGFAFWFFWLR
jgi:type IV/VI secretion system ImpK/VasF family protein